MPKRTRYDKKKFDQLRKHQYQVVTRAQAIECGFPSSTVTYMIRVEGPWQVLLPGVYLTVTGKVSQEQRETAALLYAGAGSVVTGPCAVRLHRLTCPGGNTVDVLVDANERKKSVGFVRLYRTKRMPKYLSRSSECLSEGSGPNPEGPIRFAVAARAVADAARDMNSLDDVRTVVYGAVQNKKCSVAELVAELVQGPAGRSSRLRVVLDELATDVRSHAENDLRMLIKRGRVPEPMFNAKLFTPDGTFIAMVDAWWDKEGVAAEVDSRAYHTEHSAQEKDRNRHDQLIALGVFTLHFSPQRIKSDGPRVLEEIISTIGHGRKRTRPSLIALRVDEDWDDSLAAVTLALSGAAV